MKPTLALILVIGLCVQLCQVTCDHSPKLGSDVTASTTTAKPWTTRIKDGLGKFFQGAAVVGAVQQGFQNARGSGKHKSIGHGAGGATNPKH